MSTRSAASPVCSAQRVDLEGPERLAIQRDAVVALVLVEGGAQLPQAVVEPAHRHLALIVGCMPQSLARRDEDLKVRLPVQLQVSFEGFVLSEDCLARAVRSARLRHEGGEPAWRTSFHTIRSGRIASVWASPWMKLRSGSPGSWRPRPVPSLASMAACSASGSAARSGHPVVPGRPAGTVR
jgi:hypothetical protein